jgi:SNF2 family DNA or RNA helicase
MFESPPPTPGGERTSTLRVSGIRAKLYGYQVRGASWLLRFIEEGIGCILGDEMGLGKTLQVIAALAKDREARRRPTLIVAPTTLLENWRRELARFDPGASVVVHRGASRTGFPTQLADRDVVLTSYETAVRDSVMLRLVDWRVVVADEAQALKNPDTDRASALKSLSRHATIAMTGTPLENRLRDLWSISDFVAPGYLGSRPDFEESFEDRQQDAERLGELVKPLLLRRLVKDVATDLPAKIVVPQVLELGDSASEYEALREEVLREHGAAGALVALIKLRQYCAHPSLIRPSNSDPAACSSKYARLVELLEEVAESGQKVLVFAPYTQMLQLIAEDISRRLGIPCMVLDGTIPVTKRQLIVDEFAAAQGSALLALNPRAGGSGLNIAAANHVIHYSLEWNPAVEDQATARAYRRGQALPVTVHRLFYAGTVEEYMAEVSDRKRGLATRAVIGTEGDDLDVRDVARALAMSPIKEKRNVG